jgi:hypothetical protein
MTKILFLTQRHINGKLYLNKMNRDKMLKSKKNKILKILKNILKKTSNYKNKLKKEFKIYNN